MFALFPKKPPLLVTPGIIGETILGSTLHFLPKQTFQACLECLKRMGAWLTLSAYFNQENPQRSF